MSSGTMKKEEFSVLKFRFSGNVSGLRSALMRLDEVSVDESGQTFCRCCRCLASALVQKFSDGKFVNKDDFSRRLASFVQKANTGYLNCADYRPGETPDNVLGCRSDCRLYEENVEACPFTFWECDDKEDGLQRLVRLLIE